MKNRSPAAVFFLPFITFGIYSIVWQVKTKNEMNALGAEIPTAWLIIVPIANLYWLWKYCEGVEKVTNGKMSGVLAFVLLFLLGNIGGAIIQNDFNKVGSAAVDAGPAVATSAPAVEAAPEGPNPFAPAETPAAVEAPAAPETPAAVVSPEVITPTPIDPTTGQPVDTTPPTAPQA